MERSVASMMSALKPDSWRQRVDFTDDIKAVQTSVFSSSDEMQSLDALGGWIRQHQPCVFGRLASRFGALSYCILTESDLTRTDGQIKDKIQAARLSWHRDSFVGKKSGFVIWLVSPSIAYAEPNGDMLNLATRICELYLEHEIKPDHIYLDEAFLEKPGGLLRTTWKWYAGVNYFCSQGDKRWWHDHRIPAGMALSVNSVGHLVKSTLVTKKMIELEEALGTEAESYPNLTVDSLGKALQYAMQTIDSAAETVSGRATELLPLPNDPTELPAECPISLPQRFTNRNYCEYRGYYHTDYTLPSDYFRPDVERPPDIKPYSLDFTYMFDRGLDNPDFVTMGEGKAIRNVSEVDPEDDLKDQTAKGLLAQAFEVTVESQERLALALGSEE